MQPRLRLGLGLAAFVFYLWIIHSYKLPSADLAILGLGLGVLFRGQELRIPTPLRIFAVFILWVALGLMVTENSAVTWAAMMNLIKLWIILFCIVNVVRTAAELRLVAIAWLAIFALYPVRGAFFNQYICRCTEFGRVGWNFVFENPNDLAALTFIPLGLAAGLAYVERVKFWRICSIVGVAVLSLLVMLTQSRGAMLAMGAAAIFLPLTSRRRGRDLVLLALLIGVAAVAAPKGVWQRLAGLGNASIEGGMKGVDPEGSAEARWEIWQVAAYTIQRKPLMGVGAGMMPITHRWEAMRRNLDYTARGERDTHSTYLRIAAELGIPGLLIYLVMWGSVFLHVRRVRKRLRDIRPKEHQLLLFLELSMWSFMVASIFGTYGWIAFTYLNIGVSWLAATILEKEPWYVPEKALERLPEPLPVQRPRRGSRVAQRRVI